MNAHTTLTIVIVEQHVSIHLDRSAVVVMSVIQEMESYVWVRKLFHNVVRDEFNNYNIFRISGRGAKVSIFYLFKIHLKCRLNQSVSFY